MIGATLFGYSITAPVLSVLVALAAVLLGRRRAALRHRMVAVGLGMLVVLPAVAPWMPRPVRWQPPTPWRLTAGPNPGQSVPDGVDETAHGRRGADGAGSHRVSPVRRAAPSATAPRQPVFLPSGAGRAPEELDRGSILLAWLLALAGSGIALAGARQLAATIHLRRLVRSASPSPQLDREVETLRRESGLGRPVRVVISDDVAVPITWGFRRPGIALPGSAPEWPARERRVVLLHELAHVRRGDALALAVSRLAQVLYWWNPLVWWLAGVARRDAEVASDALVVSGGVRAASYARELLAVVRRASGRPAVAGVAAWGAAPGLAERIEALHESRQPGLVTRRATWVTLVATATLAGCLGALQPSPAAGGPADGARDPGAPILPSLVEALADRSADVRRSAANALRGAEEAAAREALRQRLDDPDPHVRRAVEIALGLREPAGVGEGFRPIRWTPPVPEPGEVERLLETLVTGSEEERRAAVDRLGNLRPAAAVPGLVAALEDSSAAVRMRAASALANLGDPRVAAAVLPLLRDPDEDVRQRAASTLGNLGDPVAVSGLMAVAADPDEHVRQAVAGALGQLGDRRATLPLIELLADPDEHVRRTAAGALGDLGDPGARSALAAASRDPDPHVRRSAVESLGELRAAGAGG